MKTYKELLNKVLTTGKHKDGRNGGVLYLTGERIEVDLTAGFPLLTTKKVHFKSVVWELLWFLSGSSNIKMLQDNGVTIWDEWADEEGDLGQVYGVQWRGWIGLRSYQTDQISELIQNIKNDPYSRRHVVSAWNVADLEFMALPPCHFAFQMIVETDNTLTCVVSMRSCDIFLGLPFNIASYALLTEMLAKECGYKAGKLVINFGDLHLYENHIDAANKQLERVPLQLPTLDLRGFNMQKCLADPASQYEWISLQNYDSYPTIKAPISK